MKGSERNARLVLYVVGFVLMAVAGFTLSVSARGFLASTRLLWLSAGMSAAAIIAALASILWRARSRPGQAHDGSEAGTTRVDGRGRVLACPVDPVARDQATRGDVKEDSLGVLVVAPLVRPIAGS